MPIWRDLEISEQSTLGFLGQAAALLFFDALYEGDFHIGSVKVHVAEDDDGHVPTSSPALSEVLTALGQRFEFSRSCDVTWKFEVEYLAQREARKSEPMCVAGEGAMPTDEFNHVENYNEFERAVRSRDRRGKEWDDLLDDVAANRGRWFREFDIDAVNDRLDALSASEMRRTARKPHRRRR